jgi:hypothetical protein
MTDGAHVHRNTIQLTNGTPGMNIAGSASSAAKAAQNANSLTWLKEFKPLMT